MNYTLIVLLAYAVVMFGATVLMTKKEGNVERFCVGNRDIGWGISALSIAATWIWAPALFTSTENAYTKGFAGGTALVAAHSDGRGLHCYGGDSKSGCEDGCR